MYGNAFKATIPSFNQFVLSLQNHEQMKIEQCEEKREFQITRKPSLDKEGAEETIEEVGSIREGDDFLKQIDQTTSISVPLKTIQLIKAMAN